MAEHFKQLVRRQMIRDMLHPMDINRLAPSKHPLAAVLPPASTQKRLPPTAKHLFECLSKRTEERVLSIRGRLSDV